MLSIPEHLPEWARPLATELGYPTDIPLIAGKTPPARWYDKQNGKLCGVWELVLVGTPVDLSFDDALALPIERMGFFAYPDSDGKYQNYWPIARRVSKPGAQWVVEEWWYYDGRVTETITGLHTIKKKRVYDAAMQEAWKALKFLRDDRQGRGRKPLEEDDWTDWRELADKAIAIKKRYPSLGMETIAAAHCGVPYGTLRRWVTRRQQEIE